MDGSYYITREGGNCHSFIASLILHLITDDPDIIEFSSKGHSHFYTHSFTRNTVLKSKEKPDPAYFVVQTNEPNQPSICYEDITDIHNLFNSEPNSKIVVILVSKKDDIIIEYNHFYKAYFGLPEKVIYYWDFYKNNNISGIRKNLESFKNFTNEEIKILMQFVTEGKNRNRLMEANYWKTLQVEYPNNIYLIPFENIIDNKEKVLDTISLMTGKPVSDNLRISYQEYINLQIEHRKKNIPWLPK